MSAPLRIAFIGCGKIVERQIAEGWPALPEIAMVGWWSKRLETAEARRAQAGSGEVFSDWRTMLDRVRPDAVLVALPPFAHGEVEDELIARRIPFLVEKPVGLDLSLAQRHEAAIAEAGIVVGVGYNARFTAGVIRAKEALAGHAPVLVRGFVLNNLTRMPDFANHWWIRREFSGGQLFEQSTHHIDLIRHLLSTEICAVQAMTVQITPGRLPGADVEDVFATQMSLANGAVASFTDATVVAPSRGGYFEVYAPDLRVEITAWNRATRLIFAGGAVEDLPAEERSFTRELLGFVASVRAGRLLPPLASYSDGVKALAVAHAARRAVETGGTQRLAH